MYSLRHRGCIVRLIDTPGFDDTKKPDVEILGDIAYWLLRAYASEPRVFLSGIVYLHPIHEPRMQGTAMKNLDMFKALCGEQSLSCVVLATTMWSKVAERDGVNRQQELISTERFWKNMIDNGSRVFKHEDNVESALAIIDYIIANRRSMVLDIQRQMADEHKMVDETEAGRKLQKSLLKEKEKAKKRLEKSQEDLDQNLQSQNFPKTQELLAEQERYKREIEEKDRSLQAMKVNMDSLRKEKEAQFKKEEEQMREERKAHEVKMNQVSKELDEMRQRHDDAVKLAEDQERRQRALERQNTALVLQRDQNALIELGQWQEAKAIREAQLEVMQLRLQLRAKEEQYARARQEMEEREEQEWGDMAAYAGAGAVYGAVVLLAACVVM